MSYFQILDTKLNCPGFFLDGGFVATLPPGERHKTWNYTDEVDAEYLEFYVSGKSISDIAPPHLKPSWDKISNKKKALIKSFQNAKIDLNQYCFYDLVPESFLIHYNHLKNQITEHVHDSYERPDNYDFLVDLKNFCTKIENQKLLFDSAKMLFIKAKTRTHYSDYVRYNIFGSVTGRLTTYSDSFPILNLNKEYRSMLKPRNSYFVELDVNAAEIRTFLALLEAKQPTYDIHDWNIEHVFKDENMSRQEAKTRFFAWFYNPNNHDKELNNTYSKDYLLKRYYDGENVLSPFGRTIKTDDFHALNYLIQGAANDIVLRNILKLDKLLEGKKSFISFMIHDSVVIDFDIEDLPILKQIEEAFATTSFGRFKINAAAGLDFGAMQRIEI